MRPRLKDASGKDLELALDSRLDTSRWLTVQGTIKQGRGLQWLEAEPATLTLAKPPTETTTEEEPVRVPAGPPPEVVFSAPTDDETDVMLTTTVRIQFSRDIDQTTLKGHIRAAYFRRRAPSEASRRRRRRTSPFSTRRRHACSRSNSPSRWSGSER
jgi:hypothetical protein